MFQELLVEKKKRNQIMWKRHVLEGVSDECIYGLFGNEGTNCLLQWLTGIVDDIIASNWDSIVLEIQSCAKNNQSFDPPFWHPDLLLIQTMLTLKGPQQWIYFLCREINPSRYWWSSCPNVQQLKEKFCQEQDFIKFNQI